MAIDFPNSPSNNDSFSAGGKTWVYNGTKWVLLSVSLNQTVADSAITTAKIAAGAVTAAKLGNSITLNDIPDVTITSASSGQVLKWNGTAWINDSDVAGTSINTLDDVGDVTITSAASGQTLQWNGSAWVNAIGFSGNKQAILSSQIFG